MADHIIPMEIEALTFDSFPRDRRTDIVCLAPVRTVIRREEEILMVRRIRKVEEIDASPACPVNTIQMSAVEQEGGDTFQVQDQELKSTANY